MSVCQRHRQACSPTWSRCVSVRGWGAERYRDRNRPDRQNKEPGARNQNTARTAVTLFVFVLLAVAAEPAVRVVQGHHQRVHVQVGAEVRKAVVLAHLIVEQRLQHIVAVRHEGGVDPGAVERALLRDVADAGTARAARPRHKLRTRRQLVDGTGRHLDPVLIHQREQLLGAPVAVIVAAGDAAAGGDAASLERRAEAARGGSGAGRSVVSKRLLDEDVVVDAYDIRVRLALAHRSRVVEGHLRGDYARCVDAAVVAVCHLVDVRNQARDLGGCVRVHAGAGGVKQVERGERVVGAGRRRRRQDAVRARR